MGKKHKCFNHLSLKAAYEFGDSHGLEQEMREIRELVIRRWQYKSSINSGYTTSVKCGYVIALFERKEIFDEFKTEHWPFGDTDGGQTKRTRLLDIKAKYDAFQRKIPC